MNLYEKTTRKLLDTLNKGVMPWRKPWGGAPVLTMPQNAKTKRFYHGANVLLLWLEAEDKGYSSPYWATSKTWQRLGATVKDNELPVEVSFARYQLFNLAQVVGVDLNGEPNGDFKDVDTLVKNSEAIVKVGDRAVYKIDLDFILMPERSVFVSEIAYYTTLLHEMGHWTGNISRLNRPFGDGEDDPVYAFEELIAELTSCFMAASLRIPQALEQMPRHASYINEWRQILNASNKAIFRAADQAQKASEFLLRYKKGGEKCYIPRAS